MDLLRGTAVPSLFLTEEMAVINSYRQVSIVDCCHRGVFGQGTKCVLGTSVGTGSHGFCFVNSQ